MQAGARIAHYEVVALIGRGGMGEVWRARDTKLGRDVALKTLPHDFAADAERIARLEREARAIAALNHPNIAAIYGSEQHEGRTFLVLELVDGTTLADRLHRGPLPVAQGLELALGVAAAIESAHDQGVIHRDLKPDNIAFTRDGRVKVLDFGLAKTLAAPQSGAATVSAAQTEAGVTMGTAPYMSPEQARGELADRQTDVWAFGVVLYEILTGVSPFARPTGPETLARVLEAQPDYARLPPATRPNVVRLIRRCLEKDRRRRYRDMADVRIAVEDALAALADDHGAAPAVGAKRWRWAALAGGVVTLAVVAGLGLRAWTRPPLTLPAEVVRLSFTEADAPRGYPFGTQNLAISADGTRVAYSGTSGLTVRRLRDQDVTRFDIEGTANPLFSPDGQWVAAGALYKAPAAGGAATAVVASTERPMGASWSPDGTIVFATTSGLYRVGEDGGEPRLLLRPNAEGGELLYAWPHFLPGDGAVLLTVVPRGPIEGATIVWLDLETLERRVVLQGGTSARYTPTGHLVYAGGSRLLAVAFDPLTATTRGQPVELRDIAVASAADNGAAQFAISDNGTLVFLTPNAPPPPSRRALSWVDRDGTAQPLSLDPGSLQYPRVSPDGGRLAVDFNPAGNRDIWIWDLRRESFTRLTDGPTEDMLPLWSPDGRRVFFASSRGGNFDVYSQAADGSTPARLEHADPKFEWPASFTPDGQRLVVGEEFSDLAVLDLASGSVEPLLRRDATDWSGVLSPDGRWLAYDSNESGQFEVYLRPFPAVLERREQVSVGGGGYPRWGPPGSGELHFIGADGAMMAVSIATEPELQIGRPTRLFDLYPGMPFGDQGRPYDVAPDGRFIVTRVVADPARSAVTVTVVLNWFEELREQVPVR
jgi:serine/threonine-protein kinase